ncbi:MAG: hypothetical protein HGA22_13830 [Clostridiales bacterium]|nr:hypothetical protein [Clostridiales bacterium]
MVTRRNKGSAVVDVIFFAAFLGLVLLPVFSAVFEKYLLNEKCQRIRDAEDMANMAVYYSMNTQELSVTNVSFDMDRAVEVYSGVLAENLRLDSALMPEEGSMAESRVVIEELGLYSSGFPAKCPKGTALERPTIHSVVSVPVRPSLFRGMILSALGRDYLLLTVHNDSEIPLNR